MGYLSEKATRPISWADANKLMLANKDDKQLYCLLCLGFYTAMRRNEILSLTFEDAYNKTHITFTAKGGKTHKVKLNKRLIAAISDWYEEYAKKMYFDPKMRLFHILDGKYSRFKNMNPHSLGKMLRKAIAKTDVKVYKPTSHFMRKTMATAVWNKLGATDKALITVSGMLGHTSPASTMHYLGLEDVIFDEVYDML